MNVLQGALFGALDFLPTNESDKAIWLTIMVLANEQSSELTQVALKVDAGARRFGRLEQPILDQVRNLHVVPA